LIACGVKLSKNACGSGKIRDGRDKNWVKIVCKGKSGNNYVGVMIGQKNCWGYNLACGDKLGDKHVWGVKLCENVGVSRNTRLGSRKSMKRVGVSKIQETCGGLENPRNVWGSGNLPHYNF